MELEKIRIEGIPAVVWGPDASKIIIAAHGSHSSKIDDCIWQLARQALPRGYQVISFDLPQHGERVYEKDFIMPDECVRELNLIYDLAKSKATSVSLFGCSMGAYFELLGFADKAIDKAFFLSPVVDMERLIDNLMAYCHITPAELKERTFVSNDIEPLYYPYYAYVKAHPIVRWNHPTFILRGENDTLSEYGSVKAFCDRFGCQLSEQKDGEHWFHTEDELAYFSHWLAMII